MMRFHPSSLASLMGDAKSIDLSLLTAEEQAFYKLKPRTEAEELARDQLKDRTLSAGARTYLKAYAREFLFDYVSIFSTRETKKGTKCEQASIELLNAVLFRRYTKNTERRQTALLSGECDIYDPVDGTLDVKSCWSLDSFPILSEDCHDPTYEWQGRGYMHLWDTHRHRVAYCMVDTPDDLRPEWDQEEIHKVAHRHAPAKRVSIIEYQRDMVLEQKMLTKCEYAQRYLAKIVAQFNVEHNITPDWEKQFHAL